MRRIIIIILILSLMLFTGCSKNKIECKSFPVDNCPSNCVVCPPCAVCSSISCQTEDFCKSIGFDKEWYEKVKPK
ncbi:MAG: hypothetical protein NT139_00785 [Candidatus Woesearchaeota archaeon]|nr:hypothetical protein [Candidatus Woesearchaeota archaeon]